MPRGHRDWMTDLQQFSFTDYDIAELAARLASPATYLRGGRVAYLTAFQDSLAAWKVGGDTGYSVVLSTAFAILGVSSVELKPGTDGDKAALLYRELPWLSNGHVGLEVAPYLHGGTETWIEVDLDTESELITGRVRLVHATGHLEYYSSAGVWVQFGSQNFPHVVDQAFWHICKLTLDPVSKRYSAFRYDATLYDLSLMGAFLGPTAGAGRYMSALVEQIDSTGGQGTAYLGHLIVTNDDPD